MKPLAPLLLVTALACAEATPIDPLAERAARSLPGPVSRVRVMTQNLYVGGDVDLVIAALSTPDPSDDLPALQTAIGQFQATDFPSRAAALAEFLGRYRPHAVALQEVSTITLQLPPFGIDIYLPFLPVLQATLAARGLPYQVASANDNFNVTVIPGIALADQDVLLYDPTQVDLISSANADFTISLPPVFYGGLDVHYGWTSFVGEIGGRAYRFVGTHPDAGRHPMVVETRAAQAQELVTLFGDEPTPVILMGDLNDYEWTPLHQVLTDGGFLDAWREMHPGVAGNTCCHETDLSNASTNFDERIDYVFVKGFAPSGHLQGQIGIVGSQPGNRFDGPAHPIWVSDHAGLLATLLSPPGRTD
jgi:hypothetical protein